MVARQRQMEVTIMRDELPLESGDGLELKPEGERATLRPGSAMRKEQGV